LLILETGEDTRLLLPEEPLLIGNRVAKLASGADKALKSTWIHFAGGTFGVFTAIALNIPVPQVTVFD
jgi:hypothetical protein